VQTALDVLLNTIATDQSQSCLSECSSLSKSHVLSVAVFWQHAHLWTPWNLNSCFETPECVTMMRTSNDGNKMLPSSSNMSAITCHAVSAFMEGRGRDASWSLIGSEFSADSTRCSFEHYRNRSVTIMSLRMFLSFEITRFVCCCRLTACSAMNAMEPQLVSWDPGAFDHVENIKWWQQDATIIIEHVCNHLPCLLCLHSRNGS